MVPFALMLQLSQVQKFLLLSQKSCRWSDPFTLILEIMTSEVPKIVIYLLCLWKLLKGKVWPPEKKPAAAKEKQKLTWAHRLTINLLSSFVCNVLLGIKRTSLPYFIHPPPSISNNFFFFNLTLNLTVTKI